MAADPLSDFVVVPFTHEGLTRDVLWLGEGPAVVVMTEMPGITPSVADFSRRIVAAGFSVAMPVLFGDPGREPSKRYLASSFVKGCVAKEFAAFATNKTAPITGWLRGLVAEAHRRAGDAAGTGVGVVGMCFTGGFGLALSVDPLVQVPVLSQPSLPLGVTKAAKHDVGASPEDLRAIQARATADDDFCVIGLRFTGDTLVPAERFERYRQLLGDSFLGVEIDSSEGNPHGLKKAAHSVLSEEYRDQPGHPTKDAYDLVLEHFNARLRPRPQ